MATEGQLEPGRFDDDHEWKERVRALDSAEAVLAEIVEAFNSGLLWGDPLYADLVGVLLTKAQQLAEF